MTKIKQFIHGAKYLFSLAKHSFNYLPSEKVLNSISDAICIINPQEKLIFSNKKFKKKNLSRALEFSELSQTIKRVTRHQKSEVISQVHLKHDERDFYYQVTVEPYIMSASTNAGVILIFRDTSSKILSDLMRVNFISNVSHEMRTPLTAILGFAQVLSHRKVELPDDLASYIDRILVSSQKLQTLLKDMLTLSLIESENKTVKELCNLSDLILEVKSSMQAAYPKRTIEVQTDLLVDTFLMDPNLFEQVLNNLFDNSIKYNENECVIIHISTSTENQYGKIIYKDNGVGIPESEFTNVFDRFYRLKENQQVSGIRTEGTGLGLAIVKQILLRHKGKIWIEEDSSIKKLGSKMKFIILLPLPQELG
jgi:two-component system phosphate regulon sensor histidine kinase PhoR